MELYYPETGRSEPALEGDAIHEAGAQMIQAAALGRPLTIQPGTIASNGVVLTEAMIETAELYAHDVAATMCQTGVFTPRVEAFVETPRVHPDAGGTADCWLYWAARNFLYIWDLKSGYEIVEAYENDQCIEYASGVIDQLGLDDQTTTVVIRIVQPRAYHREGVIREWRLNAAELRGYLNRAEAAAAEAMGPNPRTIAGPQCRNCSARHACETLQRATFAWSDYVGRSTPHQLPPFALGLELHTLHNIRTLLDARITGLEAEALESDVAIPYFRKEYGVGRTEWTVRPEEVCTLGRFYNVDLRKPLQAITPKQAEAAGLPPDLVKAYSHVPKRSLKLVTDDANVARRTFAIDGRRQ